MPKSIEWPLDHINILQRMVKEGATSNQIALTLQRTRNSVIGFCYRHHIIFNHDRYKVSSSPRRRTRNNSATVLPEIHKNDLMTPLSQSKRYSKWGFGDIPTIERVAIISQTVIASDKWPSTCQFIHGEPRDRNFCDSPVTRLSSYCENHWLVCHNSV